MDIKTAIIRAGIVLIPSYLVAFATEKMVYVIPMLAASSFIATAVDFSSKTNQRRLDEDNSENENDDSSSFIDG